jgi:hypothetical protein
MSVRVSQQIVAALSATNLAHTRASQSVVANLARADAHTRASQSTLSSLANARATVHAAQIVVSILVWTHRIEMPALYPTLPGLTYSVIKRPKFFTGIGKSTTGREVRVGYALNPLWEWDLTYNYLPDQRTAASASDSDLKLLVGFYLSQTGSLQTFQFEDPDDNSVTAQVLGSTDGVTTTWVLQRSFGGGDGSGSEPVGWVNTSQPFHVYLDGALVDPASYDLLTTIGVNQQVRFHSAPETGHVLTVTMRYYFAVRFSADTYDFEKFMDKLWSIQTITLASQRA